MSTDTKKAIYKQYDGVNKKWVDIYLKTTADQVLENTSKIFFNPSIMTVNGLQFSETDANGVLTKKGITLDGGSIRVNATEESSSTITAALLNRIKKDGDDVTGLINFDVKGAFFRNGSSISFSNDANSKASLAWNATDGVLRLDDSANQATIRFPAVSGYLATQEWVTETLLGQAPDLLNTLDELAAALGDDPNFATTISGKLAEKADKSSLDSYIAKGGDTVAGLINFDVNGAFFRNGSSISFSNDANSKASMKWDATDKTLRVDYSSSDAQATIYFPTVSGTIALAEYAARVFTGTTTPTSAKTGDIWIYG